MTFTREGVFDGCECLKEVTGWVKTGMFGLTYIQKDNTHIHLFSLFSLQTSRLISNLIQ